MYLRKLLLLSLFIPSLFTAQHWTDVSKDNSKSFFEIQEAFYQSADGQDIETVKGYKQFKRWEWFWKPRVDENGEFPAPDHYWKEYKKVSKDRQNSSQAKSNADWTPLGPYDQNPVGTGPGMGRADVVAEDPNNQNILYLGSAAGGLWKSIDGGSTWEPKTDHLPTLGVSGVVVDPTDTDIIYIATGDGNGSYTGSPSPNSAGVLKSFDGGDTWQETGLTWSVQTTRTTHELVMDPSDHNVLLAATDAGVWKTYDGGENWIVVQGGDVDDILYHPTDPNIMYAVGNTFYRSNDGGDSFSVVTEGLPSSFSVGRYGIAVSPDEPDWVYVLAGNSSTSGYLGLWRSTDSGQSFVERSDSPNLLGWNGDGSDNSGLA
ncbi:MAG: glycosyl hydrolase, partial [Flavobacteriales bacterium]|nr:glycosyl hydrolase [Flavobacteriales bacterium]